ncbi:type I phosphomannose isomerase catalytic subunit [Exiguobacterium sp. SH0S7]|uniref:type I phosphomannose isomerase catalytic subunit n=1 Tax=Exiguobacterium sp. SH0S7 TaxID=2510951 RepID=UPI0013157ECA|nr:type I phosphomannose isomerase catalytic subunit [Exiguobacterium sp. SH0S7]
MNIIPLQPHYQYRLWGGDRLKCFGFHFDEPSIGEAWTASALKQGGSIVSAGPYEGMTLQALYEQAPELFGIDAPEFPLLIKWIDANDDLSIQVHPDDELAQSLEKEPYGKNECWYILDAPEGSEIIYGHTFESKDALKQALADGNVMTGLTRKPVSRGDFLYVPAGTIHALTKDLCVLEIQQSSDTTYRLYDYGRMETSTGHTRDLHVEQGALASFAPHLDYAEPVLRLDHFRKQLTRNPYFFVEKWNIEREESVSTDTFRILTVVAGSLEIDEHLFETGGTIVLPAHQSFEVKGNATCLVTGVSSLDKQKARIGIDLGGTNTRVAVVSKDGRVEKQFKFKTHPHLEMEATLRTISQAVKRFELEYEIEHVGIVAPGPLDLKRGTFLTPPNLPNWHHQYLVEPLSDLLGLPVTLENDANAAALAEAKFGAGRNVDSIFYVTVSTGVGGGFVYKKQLISGAHGSAGEIGNMIVRTEGPIHHTLNVGSLETHASGTALHERAKVRGLHDTMTLLADETERNKFVDSLATGLVNIIHTVDPDMIILGGGVTAAAALYWNQLQDAVNVRVYPHLRGETKLVLQQLKGDAGVIGAAFLA